MERPSNDSSRVTRIRSERLSSLPRLHLVTDDRVLAAPDFLRWVERVIAGGRGAGGGRASVGRGVSVGGAIAGSDGGAGFALHLRGPGTSGRRLWEIGAAILPLCRDGGVPIYVNDRIDLALLLAADGAHLGRRSLPPAVARGILGVGPLLGASVHGVEEGREVLDQDSVDFLLAGSTFPTDSHPEGSPIGLEGVREIVVAAGEIPVLAIGGIQSDRVTEVMATGAYGIALVSAVWDHEDPGAMVASLLDRIGESLQTSGELRGGG